MHQRAEIKAAIAAALDGFWLAKRTKMPDGTTAVYASNFATINGWASSGSSVAVSVSGRSV